MLGSGDKHMSTRRAALYLRVSTDDQTVENQRSDLHKLAELRGWNVVATYEDVGISGAKGREKRPGLDAFLKDAKRRRFDLAVFWSVDRLGRSTAGVATAMDELEAAGVAEFYFKESMDTSTAHGRAMLEMAAVFARLEREMIRERVKSGLARARAAGTRLGRPTVGSAVEDRIRELKGQGVGLHKIARTLGIGVSAVQRVTKAA
jgi:DNA invertase Pin-like site-specific DNA recombinase